MTAPADDIAAELERLRLALRLFDPDKPLPGEQQCALVTLRTVRHLLDAAGSAAEEPDAAELDELERLHKVATAAPWFIQGGHNDYAIFGNRTGTKDGWAAADRVFDLNVYADPKRQERDAELSIALRNAAPKLFAAARSGAALRAQLEATQTQLDELSEFAGAEPGGNNAEAIRQCLLELGQIDLECIDRDNGKVPGECVRCHEPVIGEARWTPLYCPPCNKLLGEWRLTPKGEQAAKETTGVTTD